mmetsp:Transcript_93676/g.214270  ORF Transcript_93676/g.214270 Transcript_93676/m.214270 type:complete len:551 (-) Transcript_93676:18-1670(-)
MSACGCSSPPVASAPSSSGSGSNETRRLVSFAVSTLQKFKTGARSLFCRWSKPHGGSSCGLFTPATQRKMVVSEATWIREHTMDRTDAPSLSCSVSSAPLSNRKRTTWVRESRAATHNSVCCRPCLGETFAASSQVNPSGWSLPTAVNAGSSPARVQATGEALAFTSKDMGPTLPCAAQECIHVQPSTSVYCGSARATNNSCTMDVLPVQEAHSKGVHCRSSRVSTQAPKRSASRTPSNDPPTRHCESSSSLASRVLPIWCFTGPVCCAAKSTAVCPVASRISVRAPARRRRASMSSRPESVDHMRAVIPVSSAASTIAPSTNVDSSPTKSFICAQESSLSLSCSATCRWAASVASSSMVWAGVRPAWSRTRASARPRVSSIWIASWCAWRDAQCKGVIPSRSRWSTLALLLRSARIASACPYIAAQIIGTQPCELLNVKLALANANARTTGPCPPLAANATAVAPSLVSCASTLALAPINACTKGNSPVDAANINNVHPKLSALLRSTPSSTHSWITSADSGRLRSYQSGHKSGSTSISPCDAHPWPSA